MLSVAECAELRSLRGAVEERGTDLRAEGRCGIRRTPGARRSLRPGSWKSDSILTIGGRGIEHHGSQKSPTGVSDLVFLALFDQNEAAALQRSTLSVDDGQARSVDDEQPLIRTAVR